jgi:hypothetical protein
VTLPRRVERNDRTTIVETCRFGVRFEHSWSDSKVRYITSLKRGDMGIRGKIH